VSEIPPPPVAADGPPPPQAAAPVPPARGDEAGRGARSLANWAVGCTVVLLVVCGGGAFFALRLVDAAAERVQSEFDAAASERGRVAEAEALLATLADDLVVGMAELPPTLPEAPPKDPWGNPLRYRRTGPKQGTLTSCGPDGTAGTPDDISHEIRIR
jgi:hypothetical protein